MLSYNKNIKNNLDIYFFLYYNFNCNKYLEFN